VVVVLSVSGDLETEAIALENAPLGSGCPGQEIKRALGLLTGDGADPQGQFMCDGTQMSKCGKTEVI